MEFLKYRITKQIIMSCIWISLVSDVNAYIRTVCTYANLTAGSQQLMTDFFVIAHRTVDDDNIYDNVICYAKVFMSFIHV